MRQPTPFKDKNGDQVFTDDVLLNLRYNPGFYVVELDEEKPAWIQRDFNFGTNDWCTHPLQESYGVINSDVIFGTRSEGAEALLSKFIPLLPEETKGEWIKSLLCQLKNWHRLYEVTKRHEVFLDEKIQRLEDERDFIRQKYDEIYPDRRSCSYCGR